MIFSDCDKKLFRYALQYNTHILGIDVVFLTKANEPKYWMRQINKIL